MHHIFGGSNFLKVFPKNRFFENFIVGSSLNGRKHSTKKHKKRLEENLRNPLAMQLQE